MSDLKFCPSWPALLLAFGLAFSPALAKPPAKPATDLPLAVPTSAPAEEPVRLPKSYQWSDPLDQPVEQAVKYLLSQITATGACATEFPAANPRFGGKTALCAYALLSAEVDHREPAIGRAIAWLRQQKLAGTYGIAMRACAYGAYYRISHDKTLEKPLREDVQWLIEAADKEGGYTYTSCGGKDRQLYDNSNSQVAVLGVWAGASALDMAIPASYWQRVERHWLSQQQADGGWGYLVPVGAVRTRSYGSMTAAGLATLYICFDNLNRDLFVRCAAPAEYKPIAAAQKWLADHFDAADNPAKGIEWYYYWLYSLERVGLASGERYLGEHDWYAKVLPELLQQQESQGSFGSADPVSETAFATMFLARGRHPMLLHKLSYAGKWNARPRDAANFVDWWSPNFERKVRWQAVSLGAAGADLNDAPILYISGAGPIELTEAQIQLLRTYVLQGGTIVSEAAGNNADFTLDMKKIYAKLFPQYAPVRLPAGHPIYSLGYRPSIDAGLTAITNGTRLLAVHAANELSLGLQMGTGENFRPSCEQMANICLYVTDMGTLRQRAASHWPKADAFEARVTIRVARLKYAGNYDPEPLAWQRLAIVMGNKQKVKLDVTGWVTFDDLDASKQPILAMTGTDDFKLSPGQADSLRKYLAAGGTMVIDSAGGGKPFAEAVDREIAPLVPQGNSGAIAQNHPIYDGVKIAYRRGFAVALGDDFSKQGRLRGVQDDKHLAIIFSPDDLTTGLAGCTGYGIRGYSPDSATVLMMNILMQAAGVKSQK